MRKIIFIFLVIILISVSGCIFNKEIDTGEQRCKEKMTGLPGAFAADLVDINCKNLCQSEGYTYKRWKCSEKDTLVCICNS
jgi:uncharacterized membrane protein